MRALAPIEADEVVTYSNPSANPNPTPNPTPTPTPTRTEVVTYAYLAEEQLCVPYKERAALLQAAHQGYLGVAPTLPLPLPYPYPYP